MNKYSNSKKAAFAKGYMTGLDHARTLKDVEKYPVGKAARNGYKKGINHGRYQVKQKNIYNGHKAN